MKTPSGKKLSLKACFFIFSVFLLTVIVFGHEFMKSRVPQMSGELKIPGLLRPVEVLRDKNGIPHITAQNNKDAFRALGYILASERLFQLEISRRMSQGELAEVFGEKALSSDKIFRNLGIKKESEKFVARKLKESSFPPEMLAEATAYYEGINEFVKTGPMPIEFKILGYTPKPFSLVDGQSFIALMGFSFGVAIMNEPLLSKLVARIGGDLTEDLRNEKIPSVSSRVVDAKNVNIHEKMVKIVSDLEDGFPLFDGSNGWLLAGKKTYSGIPILSNDPHISFSHPGIWFEAHIKTPDYESYGHFLSLIPFPVLSHNRERGWGVTMSLTDDMDIYREVIDVKNGTYLFKGEHRPLIKEDEVIKVKKSPDVRMTVYKTHHGPILDHAFKEEENIEKSLSLQWAFYNPMNDPMTSFFHMGRAKSMEEFKSSVATGVAPGLNILYADKENIGWWMFGEVWRKRPGIKTDFILDGSKGEDEILGSLTFEEKPHLENPESGLIISANSRPATFPKDSRGDWQPDDRYKTLESVLTKKEQWTPEEIKELQTLNMNFENKMLLDTLLSETHFQDKEEAYKKPLEILKNWDFVSNTTSIGATIYYSWTREIQIMLLKDLSDSERDIFAKVPNGWIFFKRVILDSQSPWWKKFDRGDTFRNSFKKTIADLESKLGSDENKWEWGRVHTLEFAHPLGKIKPLNYLFNLGPYPASGGSHEVNNMKVSNFQDGFMVKAGPSTRRIIDFAHPEVAWGILPAGNSGHIMSPFYDNQVKLFLNGEYREEFLDLKADSKEVRFKMTLMPL